MLAPGVDPGVERPATPRRGAPLGEDSREAGLACALRSSLFLTGFNWFERNLQAINCVHDSLLQPCNNVCIAVFS